MNDEELVELLGVDPAEIVDDEPTDEGFGPVESGLFGKADGR